MILFDLKCAQGHVFEGWFASGEDYARQKDTGLLHCPLCGDARVEKAVMAPAVAPKGNQRVDGARADTSAAPAAPPTAPAGATDAEGAGKLMQLMQALATAQGEALKESQWVGSRFAEQARAMHYGEESRRSIHGEVDKAEARALIEEGVEVAPLLFPVVPPGARN